jgi:hypothetical protein
MREKVVQDVVQITFLLIQTPKVIFNQSIIHMEPLQIIVELLYPLIFIDFFNRVHS